VEQARDGDVDAFSQLASASIANLYAVARLILRDTPRAEDAVQDALIEAWRSIRGLRDPERFDAWMHRLRVRACHRQGRTQTRRDDLTLDFEMLALPSDPGLSMLVMERG
jgi:RNA polymerase sigma-70 factor (ECF subfamily)